MWRDLDGNSSKNVIIKVDDKTSAQQQKPAADTGRACSPSVESSAKAASAFPEATEDSAPRPASSASSVGSRTFSFETLASYLRITLLPEDKDEEEKKSNDMVRPPICRLPFSEVAKVGISLSGCGFLGTYHFGAITCFLKHGEAFVRRLDRVSGASAGSLVGALLVLSPEKIESGLQQFYDMADELNSLKFGALTPGFHLNERMIKIVDTYVPDRVDQANKKLYISVTEYKTRQNALISEFADRDHLLNCLMASCFIPMYSMNYAATPPYINGNYYIDGGYTNNLPDFDDVRMITISPFSGAKADISPKDFSIFDWQMKLGNQHMNVNLQNILRGAQALFPPSRDVLKHYYNRGYKDAFRFLVSNKLVERKGTSV